MLGPGRPPRPEDQRALPYTNAVLHEVQRFITLLPHVPRRTAGSTRLGGYLLPEVGAGLGRGPGSGGGRGDQGRRPAPCGLGSCAVGRHSECRSIWGTLTAGRLPGGPQAPVQPVGGQTGRPPLSPQGTPVLPLLSSVLLDKTQWETPGQFNPGHFLDADGHFVQREAFLPFSAGALPGGFGWGLGGWALAPPPNAPPPGRR